MRRLFDWIAQRFQTLISFRKQQPKSTAPIPVPNSTGLESSIPAEPEKLVDITLDGRNEKIETEEIENLPTDPILLEDVEKEVDNPPITSSVPEPKPPIHDSFTPSDAPVHAFETVQPEVSTETTAPTIEQTETLQDAELDSGASFESSNDNISEPLTISQPAAQQAPPVLETQNTDSAEGAPNPEPITLSNIESDSVAESRETVKQTTDVLETQDSPTESELSTQPQSLATERKGASSKINRPGRRGEKVASDSRTETKPRTCNPELVCWKRGGQWYVGVEVPESHLDQEVELIQNGNRLSQEGYDEARFVLEAPSRVQIKWIEDTEARDFYIDLSANDMLVFKLTSQRNEGRRVKATTKGSYLAIAPSGWTRETQEGGIPPPVEHVIWENYQAHYFDLNGGSPIAFRDAGGQLVQGQATTVWFDLIGSRIQDATPKIGPLYGGDLPRVRLLGNRQWNETETIVVGEERKRKDWWSEEITPDLTQPEQQLPEDIREQGAGWYFVRFYNAQDELVDSLDFRFVAGLNVVVHQVGPLPRDGSHHAARIEFRYPPKCVVQPAQPDAQLSVLEKADGVTAYEIPPKPVFDKTKWRIGTTRGREIELTILVERIWWALSKKGITPNEWSDERFALSRTDIEATSDRTLWVKLPSTRWTDAISIRLGNSEKLYPVLVNEDEVSVRLREFADVEARSQIGATALVLSASHSDNQYEASIGQLNVRGRCKLCDFTAELEQDLSTHFQTNHLESNFVELVLPNVSGDDSSATQKVLRCLYCGKFYPAEESRAATKMWRHVKVKHGRPKGVYAVVEIRKRRVIQEANTKSAIARRCRYCDARFSKEEIEAQLEHLWDKHRNMLRELI